jgi:hypothetical protein
MGCCIDFNFWVNSIVELHYDTQQAGMLISHDIWLISVKLPLLQDQTNAP